MAAKIIAQDYFNWGIVFFRFLRLPSLLTWSRLILSSFLEIIYSMSSKDN